MIERKHIDQYFNFMNKLSSTIKYKLSYKVFFLENNLKYTKNIVLL